MSNEWLAGCRTRQYRLDNCFIKKKKKKSTTNGNRAHEDTLQALKFPFYEVEREGKKIPLHFPPCIKQWFYSGLQFWLQTMTVAMTEIWPDKLVQGEQGYTEGESSACENKSTGSARFRQLLLDSGANRDVFFSLRKKKCIDQALRRWGVSCHQNGGGCCRVSRSLFWVGLGKLRLRSHMRPN